MFTVSRTRVRCFRDKNGAEGGTDDVVEKRVKGKGQLAVGRTIGNTTDAAGKVLKNPQGWPFPSGADHSSGQQSDDGGIGKPGSLRRVMDDIHQFQTGMFGVYLLMRDRSRKN